MSEPNFEKYLDLFVHRRDVFSQQQATGAYFPVLREFTEDDLAEHLGGQASYGTYVLDQENTVKFIVFDLDTHDEAATEFLCTTVMGMQLTDEAGDGAYVYPLMGCTPYTQALLCEKSGNKGTHVWLFLSEPVPAEKVRRWVAHDFMPTWREAAEANGWPVALEVFPKQDTITTGGYGNLVKCPLGVHRVSGKRSEIVPHQGWANSVDSVQPLPAALVPDREPVQVETRRGKGQRERGTSEGPASPFPCVDEIMRNGVGSGNRDNAMFHLALYLYGHGIDEDIALDICGRANENFDPPLREREVLSKVRTAYSGRYESARCGTDWLADICPGPCNAGWKVRKSEAVSGALAQAQEGEGVEVTVLGVRQDGNLRRLTVGHPDANNTPTLIVGR